MNFNYNYIQTYGNSAVELRINFHSNVSSWFSSFVYRCSSFLGKNSKVYFSSSFFTVILYSLLSTILGNGNNVSVMSGCFLFTGMYSSICLPPDLWIFSELASTYWIRITFFFSSYSDLVLFVKNFWDVGPPYFISGNEP